MSSNDFFQLDDKESNLTIELKTTPCHFNLAETLIYNRKTIINFIGLSLFSPAKEVNPNKPEINVSETGSGQEKDNKVRQLDYLHKRKKIQPRARKYQQT